MFDLDDESSRLVWNPGYNVQPWPVTFQTTWEKFDEVWSGEKEERKGHMYLETDWKRQICRGREKGMKM